MSLQSLEAMPLSAAVIATGSELMLGQMTDTNSAWLSALLTSMGIKVTRHVSLGDDLPRLTSIFRQIYEEHEIVLVTGGLGPTEDDLTRLAVAAAFDRNLIFCPNLALEISDYIKKRGFNMPDNNYRQAWLPGGTMVISNPRGTAPAFYLEDKNHIMIFMPGVPAEMKFLTETWVRPKLLEKFPNQTGIIKTTILKVAGLGESTVDQHLGDLLRTSKNPSLGLLAGLGETRVLVTVRAKNELLANELAAPVISEIQKRLDGYYFGQDKITMAEAAATRITSRKYRIGIVDYLTEGRIIKDLASFLSKEYWAGALMLMDNQISEDHFSQLTNKGANLLMILDSKKTGSYREDQSLNIRVRLIDHNSKNNQEKVFEEQVGGQRSQALDRASSLALFHLWSYLQAC